MKKLLITTMFLIGLGLVASACGGSGGASGMAKVAEQKAGDNLTVKISAAEGKLKHGNQDILLSSTSTPGEFSGKVDLQMTGEWIAQISYEGKETGKTTMKVTAY
jgi:hypothetical protein